MLRPKNHLYLHVISAQNTVGYYRVIFSTANAFQALILLAFFCETNRIEKTMLIGYNFYISVDGIY